MVRHMNWRRKRSMKRTVDSLFLFTLQFNGGLIFLSSATEKNLNGLIEIIELILQYCWHDVTDVIKP